jgi:hypothetical protein
LKPIGVTTPRPVTTTRRVPLPLPFFIWFNQSSCGSRPLFRSRAARSPQRGARIDTQFVPWNSAMEAKPRLPSAALKAADAQSANAGHSDD